MKEFYAAFIQDKYSVPGDERSRLNPGHGYPAHDVDFTKVEEFKDEAEMRRWVELQERSVYTRGKYRIVKCIPMEVRTTVSVEVAIEEGKGG